MKSWGLLVTGLALVSIAIAGFVIMGTGLLRWQEPITFRSNGERIYYTTTSNSGEPIIFTGGPHWLYMHGGGCVSCHVPGGRGGVRIPMTNQIAPDIRYSALTSEEQEEHPPYTDALIKRAITQGFDPAGQPLSWAMPRWQMSERDLNDLIEYLKMLNGEQ